MEAGERGRGEEAAQSVNGGRRKEVEIVEPAKACEELRGGWRWRVVVARSGRYSALYPGASFARPETEELQCQGTEGYQVMVSPQSADVGQSTKIPRECI